MTFDEVMEKVQAKGNENQEKLKSCSHISFYKEFDGIVIPLGEDIDYQELLVTSEQFLKIYEILGEENA